MSRRRAASRSSYYSPFGAQPNDLRQRGRPTATAATTYRGQPVSMAAARGRDALRAARQQRMDQPVRGADRRPTTRDYTEFLANAENTERRLGWRANYDNTEIRFSDEDAISARNSDASARYGASTRSSGCSASIGYEDNEYTLHQFARDRPTAAASSGDPTERTKVTGTVRAPFLRRLVSRGLRPSDAATGLVVSASRNITTYPQQLATVPVGLDVASFLERAVPVVDSRSHRTPERRRPAHRVARAAVDAGGPGQRSTPSRSCCRSRRPRPSALLGARNTILFTVYNVRSEPITASGVLIPPVPGINNDNTQTGGSIVWTNNLTPRVNLTASVNGYRTVSQQFAVSRLDAPGHRPDHVVDAAVGEDHGLRRRPLPGAAIRCRLRLQRGGRHCRRLLHLSSRQPDVRILLRPDRQAVPAQPGSDVLFRQPRPQARLRLPRVRALPERGLHRHHRRDRRRQDDDRARASRAARPDEGGRRAARQHPARRRRHAARSGRRLRPSGQGRQTRRCCWPRSRRSCASSPRRRSGRCWSSTRRRT